MNRDQLAHVLRAATRITGDGDIVVLGSQSILGTYSDTELPDEVTMSVEADLAWRNDPDATKADDVDGAIGEGSQFHSEWGYYAQGVEVSTAVLPVGWEDRVEIFHRADTAQTPSTPGRGVSNRTTYASPNSSPAARRTSTSSLL
jgi:hypothetical protein